MSILFKNVLRKIAAGDAGDKPAMVGDWPYRHRGDMSATLGDKNMYYPQPYFDALYNQRSNGNVRGFNIPELNIGSTIKQYNTAYHGNPITRQQLDALRADQAVMNAGRVAKRNTPQHEAAVQYLKQRGAENEGYFKSGDLYKGGPRPKTKVQLPSNIKDPKLRKQLEEYGDVQASNNIPGGRGTGFGIV